MHYYNEFDPFAAEWLRRLIKAGELPQGDVDERDIRNLTPDDLKPYTQCHFFAGIGGWPLALRQAGWPDDKPVWTGSCPCQPFSSSGQQRGFDDDRHLWPVWFKLIQECRPPMLFGEQVAAKAALEWLDLVSDDLETAGYTVGAADLCAAGVTAPHIRQRLWFGANIRADLGMANTNGSSVPIRVQNAGTVQQPDKGGTSDRLARSNHSSGLGNTPRRRRRQARKTWSEPEERSANAIATGGLVDANISRSQGWEAQQSSYQEPIGSASLEHNLPWANPEWIWCQDNKWRPTEPELCPLADGIPNRVGQLRAYGNAIVPQVAAEFITAFEQTVIDADIFKTSVTIT